MSRRKIESDQPLPPPAATSIVEWIHNKEYDWQEVMREPAEQVCARLPVAELLTGFYLGAIEIATKPKPVHDPDFEPSSYGPDNQRDHYRLWEDMMPILCAEIARRVEGSKST